MKAQWNDRQTFYDEIREGIRPRRVVGIVSKGAIALSEGAQLAVSLIVQREHTQGGSTFEDWIVQLGILRTPGDELPLWQSTWADRRNRSADEEEAIALAREYVEQSIEDIDRKIDISISKIQGSIDQGVADQSLRSRLETLQLAKRLFVSARKMDLQTLQEMLPFLEWSEAFDKHHCRSFLGIDPDSDIERVNILVFPSENSLFPGEVTITVLQDSVFGGDRLLTAAMTYPNTVEALSGLKAIAPKLAQF